MKDIVIRQALLYPWGTPGVTSLHRTDFLCFIFYKVVKVSLGEVKNDQPGVTLPDPNPKQLAPHEVLVRKVFKIRLFKKHTEAETMEDLKKFI